MSAEQRHHRILFVCTGNICRSPTAEAVLRRMIDDRGWSGRIHVDSAGIHPYHEGEGVDPRSAAVAQRFGYETDRIRSRVLREEDFQHFDSIIAMAREHLSHMRRMAKGMGGQDRLRLFMDFVRPGSRLDVPDPYYGGDSGFIQVLRQIEEGCRAILNEEISPSPDG